VRGGCRTAAAVAAGVARQSSLTVEGFRDKLIMFS
jgi:hypothetical protein